MINNQKGFKDLFASIKTEEGLALSFFILVVVGLFMPFIGFRITEPTASVLSGRQDVYVNGFSALGSSVAWIIIAIAALAFAARHVWELFAYRDLIDSITLSALIFALIEAWLDNPISELLAGLTGLAVNLQTSLPTLGFLYPNIGMGCFIAAGICLFFSTRDRRRRYHM